MASEHERAPLAPSGTFEEPAAGPLHHRVWPAARALAGCAAAAVLLAAGKGLQAFARPAALHAPEHLRGRQELFAAAGSSFCFAVARTDGYELDVIVSQYRLRAGLFACDDRVVFCDKEVQIAGDFFTTAVGAVAAQLGGGTGPLSTASWVNTASFLKAWAALRDDGRYLNYDWTIKVDPDTVFFPEAVVRSVGAQGPAAKVFFNNCAGVGNGFYGSLEVMSRAAMQTFLESLDSCTVRLQFQGWGEDLFCQKCMEANGVVGMPGYGLVQDGCCHGVGSAPGCTPGRAAYHPFKGAAQWETCYNQAGGAAAAANVVALPASAAPGAPAAATVPVPASAALQQPGLAAAATQQPLLAAGTVQQPWPATGPLPSMGAHHFPVEEVVLPREHHQEGGGAFSTFLPGLHRLK